MSLWKRHGYKYVDDTDDVWGIHCVDYIAEAGGLEQVVFGNPEKLQPMGRNYKPRHIKLVALEAEPGRHKYRTDVITNERDPSKLVGKIVLVRGVEMRCVRYVGEQRTGR